MRIIGKITDSHCMPYRAAPIEAFKPCLTKKQVGIFKMGYRPFPFLQAAL